MLVRSLLLAMLAIPLWAQPAAVSLGGIPLRLGAPKATVLAEFEHNPSAKLDQPGDSPDFYLVMTKTSGDWEIGGELIFDSGKLARIVVHNDVTNDQAGTALAKGFYEAVSAVDKADLLGVTSGSSADAYEVRLRYKDREVVVRTKSLGRAWATDVTTFYPRSSEPLPSGAR
jgi:hypothetical protein